MARKKQRSTSKNSPLPYRDGVPPSYLILPCDEEHPKGRWPDLLSFLQHRFPHIEAEVLRQRLAKGDLVDDSGQALTEDADFIAGKKIWYYREVPNEQPVPFEESIVYEDDLIVIADKPHWLSTIPAGRHLKETLLIRLRKRLNLPDLVPAHRLDRETAGLVLLCKQPEHRGAYQTLFQQRNVQKTYRAVAGINPDLELPRIHRSLMVKGDHFFTMKEAEGEPNSETAIDLLLRQGERALYEMKPHTGRQHQLRVHLASMGIPIENDPWYPEVQAEADHDDYSHPLQLLAYTLVFTDPVTGEERFFKSQQQLTIPHPEASDS